jgi:Zn-dependent protease
MAPVIFFSLTVHEYSHGRIALLLGDDTAQRLGRLSFNPFKHLDLIGTLIFFLLGFGWAKPVPVDPKKFDQPRRDMMYVAIAGPLSNLALAVIFSYFIRVFEPYDNSILFVLLCFGVYVNVALAIFNLLPVFPLDGSSVIKGLVPNNVAARLGDLDRFGAFLLIGIFLMDKFAHTGIIGAVLWVPIMSVVAFLSQDAFLPVFKMLMSIFSKLWG